ncbi:unnamed protein product, partial [marine sediment metagenome]
MKYISYFLIGLGISFVGYFLPFCLSHIIDYSGSGPREEPLPYANIVFYFLYSLIFLGPLVFWVVIPLVKV